MNKYLIIPQLNRIDESIALAEKYGFGFEYNDFSFPDVLDSPENIRKIVSAYKSHKLPDYCTVHGDFFDVIVFSIDRRIREISEIRVRQSIDAAREIGAHAVVFHTNHNPFFNTDIYLNGWLEKNSEFWSRILEENPDMNIYIENMCDFSPTMLFRLAQRLKDYDNFGICLDYAHASVFGKNIDIESWVKTLAPYVKHIHINDNDLMFDLHLAVGSGLINWHRFSRLYNSYLSDATVLIETASIEMQRESAEFLHSMSLIQ